MHGTWLRFALLLGILADPFAARAGGLYLSEFATPSDGVASAGRTAMAADASTALHNPAGMTRLDHHALVTGGGLIFGSVRFDPDSDTPFSGGSGGNQASLAPLLSAHYVHRAAERWRAGVSLLSLSGSALDPSDDWAGRFQVTDLSLLTLTLFPSVAFQLTEELSVGAGAILSYGTLDYELAVDLPGPLGERQIELEDLDDFEAGFSLGALWEPTPRTRLGLVYFSEVDFELSGDVDVPGPALGSVDLDLDLPLAQFVKLGIYHELGDHLAVLGEVGWEDWSTLESQFVSVGSLSGDISREWHDTWRVAVGLQYRVSPNWLFQTGFAYDSSPVDSDDRSADLPIDRQLRVAVGAQRRWSETTVVGAALTWANLGRARIRSSSLRGDYRRNDVFFLSFYVDWRRLPWSD